MFYKVLIVEDEDAIRKGLRYGFDWNEVNCIVVDDTFSAIEALELIDEHDPDILVADINLPMMSGLELIAKTHNTKKYSSIIISGYADFKYAQEAIELGVVRFLSKPINNEELKEAILVAIDEIENNKLLYRSKVKELNDRDSVERIIKDYHNQGLKDPLILRIIEYVDTNYSKKIKLSEVSEELNYSESTINSRLKAVLGTTFTQYLNQVRVFKAIEYFKQGYYENLQEVGYKVGISDYQHFVNVFKKYTEFTPKEFVIRYFS